VPGLTRLTHTNMSKKQLAFRTSLQAAEKHLARRDPLLRALIKRHAPCRLQPHTRYFETLVTAIISQQLSTKAADTIETRFKALYAPARSVKPEQIIATPNEALRGVGLSQQKANYIKDLAAKTHDGTLRLRQLARLEDEAIIEMLTQVKGIGVWTVQMFLIFSLGRLNVLPVGDLGIRKAVGRVYGLGELADAPAIEALADARGWRPYCSVASWYLWRSLENKP
jgi:DNA-3-methyladenine glycosylase II